MAPDLVLQLLKHSTSSGVQRKLDDFMLPAILAKCSDLPYPQEGEADARNREPSTDRSEVGSQQAPKKGLTANGLAWWLNEKEPPISRQPGFRKGDQRPTSPSD